MKILLNESNFSFLLLHEYIAEQNNTQYKIFKQKNELAKKSLENLLSTNGILMTNIENGKDYVTYELKSLQDILGKRYCICRLIKDNDYYGQISLKPLSMFKSKNF